MKGRLYYSRMDYLKRMLWALLQVFFRGSPRLLYGFRRQLLRLMGAEVSKEAWIYPAARITFPWNLRVGAKTTISWDAKIYNLGAVTIGDRVVISQGAHLCAGTHDYEAPGFPLLKKRIVIEDDVWVAADAFIGPGVTIGRRAVIGARAVVMSDVPPGAVVAGNPAKLIKQRVMPQ